MHYSNNLLQIVLNRKTIFFNKDRRKQSVNACLRLKMMIGLIIDTLIDGRTSRNQCATISHIDDCTE